MRRIVLVVALVLVSIVVAVWFAWDGSSGPFARASGTTVRSESVGITVQLPDGWHHYRAGASLVLHTTATHISDGDCYMLEGAKTTIVMTLRGGPDEPESFEASSAPFGPRSGTGVQQYTDDEDCDEHSQAITFAERGQLITAELQFGPNSPDPRHREAYRILDTLRVGTSLREPAQQGR